jgi:hypothetical protein
MAWLKRKVTAQAQVPRRLARLLGLTVGEVRSALRVRCVEQVLAYLIERRGVATATAYMLAVLGTRDAGLAGDGATGQLCGHDIAGVLGLLVDVTPAGVGGAPGGVVVDQRGAAIGPPVMMN